MPYELLVRASVYKNGKFKEAFFKPAVENIASVLVTNKSASSVLISTEDDNLIVSMRDGSINAYEEQFFKITELESMMESMENGEIEPIKIELDDYQDPKIIFCF